MTAPDTPHERRRRLRLGLAVALAGAVAVVTAGGAVAVAGGDQAPEHAADHDDDHDRHPLPRDHGNHGHEPLTPYEQRYAAASAEERRAADDLLADVRRTLTAYEDADAAVAAGYRSRDRAQPPIGHYLDRAAARDDRVLDPAHPDGLIYTVGGEGEPMLLGAFFVAPPGAEAPRPAGDLVTWHSHSPSCPGLFVTTDEPCTGTRRMLHVWTAERAEVVARRTGRAQEVQVTDPFGTPFYDAVVRIG